VLIYFSECGLKEGFQILSEGKDHRLIRGIRVSRPSGYALFEAMQAAGETMKCWECGLIANCWIANKGRNDHLRGLTLDLFAVPKGAAAVLMTRDHIIPRSLGGSNENANLRVGCSPCNGARGNRMDPIDVEFMEAHPELIVRPPNPVVQQCLIRTPEEKLEKKRADRKRRTKARRDRENEARKLANGPPKQRKLEGHPLISMMVLALA